MQKDNIGTITPATLITTACLVTHIFVPCDIVLKMQQDSILLYAVCYSLSHVGWIHLVINLYALWLFRPRPLTCLIAFLSAFLSSLLLSLCSEVLPQSLTPCVGLSGFLFAAVARYYVSWNKPILFPILINIAMLLINILWAAISGHISIDCLTHPLAWHIHLLSFFSSYIFWFIYYKQKRG